MVDAGRGSRRGSGMRTGGRILAGRRILTGNGTGAGNGNGVDARAGDRGDGIDDSGRGVIHRLYDTVNKAMDLIKERAGSAFSVNHQFTIGREIMDIEDRIERFEERLIKIEDRYWRQFTAMEKAIQRANTQMGYLWQQFGGY